MIAGNVGRGRIFGGRGGLGLSGCESRVSGNGCCWNGVRGCAVLYLDGCVCGRDMNDLVFRFLLDLLVLCLLPNLGPRVRGDC